MGPIWLGERREGDWLGKLKGDFGYGKAEELMTFEISEIVITSIRVMGTNVIS